MKNKELMDRHLMRIENNIKNLHFMLGRQTEKGEFTKELNSLSERFDELKSLIEKNTSPLRYG